MANNYFSHDSNARNDAKLINLRMRHGAAGYGVYFMILERMREETNYMCAKDYNMIAFDLRVDAALIKSVVEDFGLFVFAQDGKYFYSESFLLRMSAKDEIARKRSEAGKAGMARRWQQATTTTSDNKPITNVIQNDSNESKENKSKENSLRETRAREREWVEEFLNSKIQIEALCMQNGVSEDKLRRLADEVLNDWTLADVVHINATDAKTHLLSTIRIKIQQDNGRTITTASNSTGSSGTNPLARARIHRAKSAE